jgi:hypothetical protein
MDASHIPAPLPPTVTRPRPLAEVIMAQSLREQGTSSQTAQAWEWVLTGQAPSPISQAAGGGSPPGIDEIVAEARYGRDTDPPQWASWPPWRYAFDHDPDRQQARRVLRWLAGAADAIPLLDPARGRHVGARFHLARTDGELRLVRGWAQHGIRRHGDLPQRMSPWESGHPWQWPSGWMNAAWLRGAIDYLGWILSDTPMSPLTFRHIPLDPATTLAAPDAAERQEWLRRMYGVGVGAADIENEVMGFRSAVTAQGMRASRQLSLRGSPRLSGAKASSRPTTGRPARTTSRQPTTTDAAATTPALACSAAPAKPPGTVCPENALRAGTRSVTPDGPSSKRTIDADQPDVQEDISEILKSSGGNSYGWP